MSYDDWLTTDPPDEDYDLCPHGVGFDEECEYCDDLEDDEDAMTKPTNPPTEQQGEMKLPPIEDTFGLGAVPVADALRQRERQLLQALQQIARLETEKAQAFDLAIQAVRDVADKYRDRVYAWNAADDCRLAIEALKRPTPPQPDMEDKG